MYPDQDCWNSIRIGKGYVRFHDLVLVYSVTYNFIQVSPKHSNLKYHLKFAWDYSELTKKVLYNKLI